MRIIDGKKIAQEIVDELKIRPKPDKIFAAILVGDDLVSRNFLKQKEKIAKKLGVDFRLYEIKEPIGGFTNDFLRREVGKIALLKRVGGVIVQLPLPENINYQYVLNIIPREKDVDVLGERALGAFYTGRNLVLPSVGVLIEILKRENFIFSENLTEAQSAKILQSKILGDGVSGLRENKIFSDQRVAVVGAGFLIGKPIAVWLINQKIKELAIFEKGGDLTELRNYDLIISGTGVAGLINPKMLKERAVIIDFGYSIDESGKIRGDFNSLKIENSKLEIVYTPTPGGTGPILVAKVFENFYNLNKNGEIFK